METANSIFQFSGSMMLFITPGVREFVQQYHLIYIFLPLPVVSKILISVVEGFRHPPSPLLIFPTFLIHLLAIFLSFACFSLNFDTEIVYFSCFVICGNFFQLILYSFQNMYYFPPITMFVFLIVTSVSGSFFLQIALSIFDFPFFEISAISVLVSMYININIQLFMNSFSSGDWLLATVNVFTKIPVL